MRIDNISNNSFKGKLWISPSMGINEKNFVEKILNYRVNGISNMELLAQKKFDMNITAYGAIQAAHPKIKADALINYIITSGRNKCKKNQNHNPLEIRIEDGARNGAVALRRHLDDTDDFISRNYPTHYYGKRECFKQRMRVLFGKV